VNSLAINDSNFELSADGILGQLDTRKAQKQPTCGRIAGSQHHKTLKPAPKKLTKIPPSKFAGLAGDAKFAAEQILDS